jgi:predicted DNA-binding protein with PD1-like motif
MMLTFEIKDAELMSALEVQLKEAGVRSGAVASLIGAVDSFTVSTMPANDAAKDNITDYSQPAEMHGCGEVVEGKPHLHVTMAVEGDRAISGHLHRAQVGHWFARAYVIGS